MHRQFLDIDTLGYSLCFRKELRHARMGHVPSCCEQEQIFSLSQDNFSEVSPELIFRGTLKHNERMF